MSKSELTSAAWRGAALAVLGLLSAGTPAEAACFESGIGCTDDHHIPSKALKALSCDALWTVRNTIYDENGYCFRSARAKAIFSNDGCLTTDASRVTLNRYERANVGRIAEAERKKGCD
jgi:hypothetical protein